MLERALLPALGLVLDVHTNPVTYLCVGKSVGIDSIDVAAPATHFDVAAVVEVDFLLYPLAARLNSLLDIQLA